MQYLSEWIHQILGIHPELQSKLGGTVLAIILLWLTHEISLRVLSRQEFKNKTFEYRVRKTISYSLLFLAIIIIGRIWFAGFDSISTILGLASAGIAIALRDPIVNFAAWFYILWEKPFAVGDRIQVGEHKGDVIDQQFFHFTIMEIDNWIEADLSTGRMIHVPNGILFHESLSNYNEDFPFVWDRLTACVTFESDWEKAKEILQSILEEETNTMTEAAEKALHKAGHKFLIRQNRTSLEPHIFTEVTEYGVSLNAHYVVQHTKRSVIHHEIWENVLRQYNKDPNIHFAYPTRRVVDAVYLPKRD